jgi:RNA polymerase-binding transcription factor DksA
MPDYKHPDLDDSQVQPMRKLTLAKLGTVCDQLEKLLAGQDVTLVDIKLPHQGPDSDWTKIMRLRAYKKMLNDTLKRMSEPEFGLSLATSEPIPVIELREMPWAEMSMAEAQRGLEPVYFSRS